MKKTTCTIAEMKKFLDQNAFHDWSSPLPEKKKDGKLSDVIDNEDAFYAMTKFVWNKSDDNQVFNITLNDDDQLTFEENKTEYQTQ